MQTKECSKCGRELPTSDFYSHAGGKYGVRADCKECFRSAVAERRSKLDPLVAKIQNRKWYEANRERHRNNGRKWRLSNPDKAKASSRKYYYSHHDQALHRISEYAAKNPGKRKALKHRRRALESSADGYFTDDDVVRIYAEQDGACAYCKRPLKGGFHLDHATPLSRGGSNWPDNIRCACASCNLTKFTKTAEEFMSYLTNLNAESS